MIKEVYIIGIGPGNINCLTAQEIEVLNKAQVVFGAERIIENIDCAEKKALYLASDIIPEIEALEKSIFVVAFSGDTGFYSGADKFVESIKRYAKNSKDTINVSVLPGISSVSYFASKLGEGYSEAFLGSIHGKNTWADLIEIIRNIRTHGKSFILLSNKADAKKLWDALLTDSGNDNPNTTDIPYKMIVGSRLSYEDEKIVDISDVCDEDSDLCLAFITNNSPERRRLIPVLLDEEFERGKVPMSKETIRHESIIALNLRENDVVFDVGSGTGSVAVEMAGLSHKLKIYALEMKDEALELISSNVKRFGCENIEIVPGDAAETIGSLPAPNAIFIGGSHGKLKEILSKVNFSNAPIRIVLNAISLETIAKIKEIESDFNVSEISIRQILVSKSKKLGDYNLLQAENPVMICSFDLFGYKEKNENN